MVDKSIGTLFSTALKDPAKLEQPSRIYHLILALLFLMLLTVPTIGHTIVGRWLNVFIFAAIFVGSLFAVRYRKVLFWLGISLMGPAIVLRVLGPLSTSGELWRAGLAVAAFLFIAVVFVVRILSYSRVTPASVSGSLCVYFIFGIIWAILYAALERFAPGSFSGLDPETLRALDRPGELPDQFLYFSYVTLTTLGYGDIAPMQPVAETLAMVEAVAGQLFLVGMVAYLVGRSVASDTS